jgi:hypothetical protein
LAVDEPPLHSQKNDQQAIDEDQPNLAPAAGASNAWRCPHCTKSFRKQSKLTFVAHILRLLHPFSSHLGRRHLKRHDLRFKCKVAGCTLGFADQKDLDRHKDDVNGTATEIYYCTYPGCNTKACRDGSSRHHNMTRHLRITHGLVGDAAHVYIRVEPR